VLAPIPSAGLFLVFGLVEGHDPRPGFQRFLAASPDAARVVGLGEPLVRTLGGKLDTLRTFPALSGPGCSFPSTQGALWTFLSGSDPGELLQRGRRLLHLLGDAYRLQEEVSAFKYREGRDLTGYMDGTENPKGPDAIAAAIVSGGGPGLDGSSYVAVQKYVHNLNAFERLPQKQRDETIGRRQSTDEEYKDAPASAHIKRAAQESFTPSSYMVRRSMPWGAAGEHGLYFVAYGNSLDRFERVLTRMAGREDGVVDSILSFSRAVSGGYYFIPPLQDSKLDLRAIGLSV
jgi:putative iron-dependent peroxidase